jgi:carboxylesterase
MNPMRKAPEAFVDIMKGWEAFSYEGKSDIGVLVSQGFTGSTASVAWWGKKLAEAGYQVEGPRLTGHGTRWQDLNRLSWRDWIADIEAGYDRLKKRSGKIFVAGLSFGGALALHLAETHAEITGILLVNHAIRVDTPLEPLLPLLRHFLPSVPAISNDIKDPAEHELAYDRTPVGGVCEMNHVLRMVRKRLKDVHQPILIMKSREDHVLPAHNATITLDGVASAEKSLVWLENSFHVATQDFDKERILALSLEFIRSHAGGMNG